jgi:hypothetical protein
MARSVVRLVREWSVRRVGLETRFRNHQSATADPVVNSHWVKRRFCIYPSSTLKDSNRHLGAGNSVPLNRSEAINPGPGVAA